MSQMVLPSGCVVMNDEEMEYLEGGKTISYSLVYCNPTGAAVKAASLKLGGGFGNISTYDLSAEIWFHAYAYYHAGAMLALMGKAGISKAANFWSSLKNGIDVDNGLDTKKEFGIPRYQIFRATYAYAIANPAIII